MNERIKHCGIRWDILDTKCNCQSCIEKRELDKKVRKSLIVGCGDSHIE